MKILYEDKYMLAVLKEAGIPIQSDKSQDRSLLSAVNEYTSGSCHIITRLDRPVGGISLFAKDKETAARLSEMIRENKADKIYTAILCGKPLCGGHIEDYIFKNERTNTSKIVNKGSVGAKLASLSYDITKSGKEHTLVRIYLETGRHHQIRVQFAHMGYPLYGDTKYNEKYKHKRGIFPALFASEMKLVHPITGDTVHIKAENDPVRDLFEKLEGGAV